MGWPGVELRHQPGRFKTLTVSQIHKFLVSVFCRNHHTSSSISLLNYVDIHTYLSTYVPTYLPTYYLRTYLRTYVHTCIHAYVHTYIHTHIYYIFIFTCIDIHIHMHTVSPQSKIMLGQPWMDTLRQLHIRI